MLKQSVLGDYSVRPCVAAQRSEVGRSGPKIFWFVVKGTNRMYKVRALNERCMPSGVAKELDIEEFMTNFSPEPDHYVDETVPAIRSTLNAAETVAEKRDIVAKLGIEIDETVSVEEFMERLFIDARFVCFEQSREINEYIIRLRKRGELDEAVRFCEQALALSPHDENLLFNVARVHLEKSDYVRAGEFIERALLVEPDMVQARKFKKFLEKRTRKHVLEMD